MGQEYDREWTTTDGLPNGTRIRQAHSTKHGAITKFVVQIEYDHGDEWHPVVRSDHNPDAEMGHDVTDEGVHLDVYRDGEKIDSPQIFPAMPANEAYDYAETHLEEHAERYIKRYNEWHNQ